MAIAFAFGSYTNNKENLITSTGWIIFMHTLFAVIAGLIIFPTIFSRQLDHLKASGPHLITVQDTPDDEQFEVFSIDTS